MRFFCQGVDQKQGPACMRRALEVGLWGSFHNKTPVPPYSNVGNLWIYQQKGLVIKDSFLFIVQPKNRTFILGRVISDVIEEFNLVHPWIDISDEPVWGLSRIDWYTSNIKSMADYGLNFDDHFHGYITMRTPNLKNQLDRHLTYKRVLEQIVQEESIKLAS